MDKDLDLNYLFDNFNFINRFFKPLLLHKIKGFNQSKAQLNFNRRLSEPVFISFYNTKFEFYLNGTIMSEKECLFSHFNANQTYYFGSMRIIAFTDNVFYAANKVCPYVFTNSQ